MCHAVSPWFATPIHPQERRRLAEKVAARAAADDEDRSRDPATRIPHLEFFGMGKYTPSAPNRL